MTEKRFKITQNGDLFTVRDTVENKPLGVFEFKENEFPVYACFHHIIDLLNELDEEKQQLEKENKKLKQVNEMLQMDFAITERNLMEENEQLKTIRSDLISELDIVQNELNIAIDEGFAPSKSYKNYMVSKKTEYDKFWENKIKTHNNRLKELKE